MKTQDAVYLTNFLRSGIWLKPAFPAQLLDIKKLGLDAIAMIRKSSKIRYIYEGKKLNLNKIYGMNKKRRGCSRYLLSVNVEIQLLLLHTLTGDIEDTMIRQMFLENSRSMSGHHGLP